MRSRLGNEQVNPDMVPGLLRFWREHSGAVLGYWTRSGEYLLPFWRRPPVLYSSNPQSPHS